MYKYRCISSLGLVYTYVLYIISYLPYKFRKQKTCMQSVCVYIYIFTILGYMYMYIYMPYIHMYTYRHRPVCVHALKISFVLVQDLI